MFKRVLRFYSTDKDTKKGDFDEKVAAQSQDDDGLTMTQILRILLVAQERSERCSEMFINERELTVEDEEPWRGWKGRRSTNERNVLLPYKVESQPLAMRTLTVT